jgi:alkylation response protein AidB-like acyl-CoA dehydrogenase
MDFKDTPEEAEFRTEVRAFLDQHVRLRSSSSESAFDEAKTDADRLAIGKRWQKLLADNGWACIAWPESYGGRGVTPIQNVIWNQEVSRYVTPDGMFIIGQGMCGPTLMAHATEKQKEHHLPRIASADEVWCQLFSEPVAGSDLAGIKTKAVKDGDDWVVNGQKVWTSGAHYSDWAC